MNSTSFLAFSCEAIGFGENEADKAEWILGRREAHFRAAAFLPTPLRILGAALLRGKLLGPEQAMRRQMSRARVAKRLGDSGGRRFVLRQDPKR